MSTSHYTQRGRFNLLDARDYSEQIVLRTAHGTVSALWPDGECPYDEDAFPSQIAELIRDRLKRYLFMSDRDQKIAILDAIKADAKNVDGEWLRAKAANFRAQAERLLKRASQMESEADELLEDA